MTSVELAAVLPPPTAGLPWPAKILWFLAKTVATGIAYQQFTYGQGIFPTGELEVNEETTVWMHAMVIYEDQISQDTADDQVFTLDILNYTGDLVDNSWTTGDFNAMNTHIGPFTTAIRPYIDSRMLCREVRYYARSFNPIEDPKPFANSGGPANISPVGGAGTGGGTSPPQVTTTVTEMTPSRPNWGRFYLPTLGAASVAPSGRLLSTAQTAIATAAATMVEGLWDAGFKVVVPTTSVGGTKDISLEGDFRIKPVRTLQAVTAVRVDDVIDAHRSRRHKNATLKTTLPV